MIENILLFILLMLAGRARVLCFVSSHLRQTCIPLRHYCILERAPDNQEAILTPIPENYYSLRHNPAPEQKLWEDINEEGLTSTDLFKMVTKKMHIGYIQPVHFEFTLRALNEAKDLQRIKTLAKFMKKWRFPITREHYMFMIVNTARLGDIQRASTLIYDMKNEYPDYEVKADLYDGHIGFWASKGKVLRATKIMENNVRKDIPVSASNYEELVSNYQNFGASKEELLDIVKEMEAKGFSSDRIQLKE